MAKLDWVPSSSTRALAGPAALLVAVITAWAGGTAAAEPDTGTQEQEAPIVVEADDPSVDVDDPDLIADLKALHDEFEAGTSVPVTAAAWGPFAASAVSSGMTVSFDATHTAPADVQSVVISALATWDATLATTTAGPVEIGVIWRDLGSPSLLGSAGPNGLFAHGQLPSSDFYPVPLANTLLGTDLRPGEPEIFVNLNSTANWYKGTGTPGSGQIDLRTVVLHEVAHGLGFLGSASLYNDTPHTDPTLESPTAFIYDRQAAYQGTPLLNLGNANDLLESNQLDIHTSDHLTSKLYAPGTWAEGSSFSHFDETAHPAGSPGSLMSPSLASQEVARLLDTPTLGVMARLGWPMRVGATTPTITSTSPVADQITVNWTLDQSQTGVAPDTFRVEALLEGNLAASVSVAGSVGSGTIGGLTPGNTYTMRVVPVARGIDGTPAAAVVDLATVPTTPTAVKVAGEGLTPTVSWLVPVGVAADTYEVEQSTEGGDWTAVGSTTSQSLAVTVTEGIHQFRVRGHSGWGTGAWGYSIPTGIGSGVVRPVALDGQVARLYGASLGRDPDAVGFAHWLEVRAGGLALVSMSDAFVGSSEFQATYGSLSNTEFVDLVYLNVMGRLGEPAGRNYWTSMLDAGMTRGQLMTGFSESPEMVLKTATVAPTTRAYAEVYRLYVAFFLRYPDPAGFDYWVSQRESGVSLEAIATAFAASAEFQTRYGSLGDADFVKLVYHNVLARDPDLTGAQYWEWFLSTGASRGTMMTGFSESAEFIRATGTLP